MARHRYRGTRQSLAQNTLRMIGFTKPLRASCSLLLAGMLLSACASAPQPIKANNVPTQTGGAGQPETYAWHQLRLKWHWSDEEPPKWELDLLIADRVLRGIIRENHSKLPLWRFHRRAGNDAAGHQFSLIFFSPETAVVEIEERVRDHATTQALLEAGLLEKITMNQREKSHLLGATSDKSWPQGLQDSWPMFIMGVSSTWLALVHEYASEQTPSGVLESDIEHYKRVGEKVDQVWYDYAQHAFFHHISGIFGYAPVLLQKQLRF